MKNIKIIKEKIKGQIEKNKSLKEYNTWKVGGKAEYFYEPDNLEELKIFLSLAKRY